jgi:hypothetical protein
VIFRAKHVPELPLKNVINVRTVYIFSKILPVGNALVNFIFFKIISFASNVIFRAKNVPELPLKIALNANKVSIKCLMVPVIHVLLINTI